MVRKIEPFWACHDHKNVNKMQIIHYFSYMKSCFYARQTLGSTNTYKISPELHSLGQKTLFTQLAMIWSKRTYKSCCCCCCCRKASKVITKMQLIMKLQNVNTAARIFPNPIFIWWCVLSFTQFQQFSLLHINTNTFLDSLCMVQQCHQQVRQGNIFNPKISDLIKYSNYKVVLVLKIDVQFLLSTGNNGSCFFSFKGRFAPCLCFI